MMAFIFAAIITYFCGSLPSGVWLGKKFKNIDIREHGSKNSGATNAYRVLGAKYGIIVMVLDALKGFLPLLFANKVLGINGIGIVILGFIAILGHTLSCFLNFKGGKGVATSLGVFLFLFPAGIFSAFIIFALITVLSKYISLASIVSATMLFIFSIFMPVKEGVSRGQIIVLTFVIAVFIIYKHKENIKRLLAGTENKFGTKHK